MKRLIALICVIFLTGCSTPRTKQTIELNCENGLITFKWWKADVLDDADIKYPSNLRHSGFYTDDNGKHMKCVEEINEK